MTCIAAVRGPDGVVWMGADSSSMRQDTKISLAASKVTDLGGGVYMGVAGKHYTLQAVKHGFSFAHPRPDSCVAGWMVTVFCPALRQRFEDMRAWNHSESDNEPLGCESLLLVVAQSRIFEVSSLCQPVETGLNYHAIGNGEDVALGVLYTLERHPAALSPQDRLEVALQASSLHRENVAPPFTYLRCSPSP